MSHIVGIKNYLDGLVKSCRIAPGYYGYPYYNKQIVKWWNSVKGPTDKQIIRTIMTIKQLLTYDEPTQLYGIRYGMFINYEFEVDDPSYLNRENRMITINQRRYEFYCKIYMKLTDFYKLCYGIPVIDCAYMNYRIVKVDFKNKSEELIICNNKIIIDINSETFKECMKAPYLTQGISDKIEIQKSLDSIKQTQIEQLQTLEALKDLPTELLELTTDYLIFKPDFSRWN